MWSDELNCPHLIRKFDYANANNNNNETVSESDGKIWFEQDGHEKICFEKNILKKNLPWKKWSRKISAMKKICL